jgi:hypothetical protein
LLSKKNGDAIDGCRPAVSLQSLRGSFGGIAPAGRDVSSVGQLQRHAPLSASEKVDVEAAFAKKIVVSRSDDRRTYEIAIAASNFSIVVVVVGNEMFGRRRGVVLS